MIAYSIANPNRDIHIAIGIIFVVKVLTIPIIIITTGVVVLPSITIAISKQEWIRGFACRSVVAVKAFAISIVKVATGGIVLVKVLTDSIAEECRIWNDAVADLLVECHDIAVVVDSAVLGIWDLGCK